MSRSVNWEASSELGRWDSAIYPPAGGSREDAKSGGVEGGSVQVSDLPSNHSASDSGSADDIPENQANNAYCPTSPFLYAPSGQGLDDSEETRARGDGASVLDGIGPPSLHSALSPRVPTYYYLDALDPNANYGGTMVGHLDYQHVAQFSPTPRDDTADFGHGGTEFSGYIPSAQNIPTAGWDQFGDQHSSTEPNHADGLYDGETPRFPDSGGTCWSHRPATEPHFDRDQAIPSYLYDGAPKPNYSYDGATGGYFDRQHATQLFPPPHADVAEFGYEGTEVSRSIPLTQDSHTADGFHFDGQHSSAESNYSHVPHGGDNPGFPDSEGTRRPHRAATESHPHLDHTQVIPMVAHGTGIWRVDSLPSHSTVKAENERTAQVPTELSSLGTNNGGIKHQNKGKRATTSERKREGKRARRKTPQRLVPQVQILAAPVASLPTRPDLRIVEQVPFQCGNSQKNWVPLPSIDFRAQGQEGIKLTDAVNKHFDGPEGRDDPMLQDASIANSVSCRMHFVGYSVSSKPRQIVTTNHKKTRDPIDKKKLGHDVAKRIESYLEELKEDKTPFHVQFEDMFLVRLHHVSRASWRPEIWYRVTPSASS